MELKNLGQTAASALIHTDNRLEREHWTMFRQKLFGIAAAATLGSAAMVGTSSANAIDLDAMADAKANPAVTYATETLSTKVEDGSMYYVLADGANMLDTTVALGVAGAGADEDDLIITFTLDGMVFTETSAAAITGLTATRAQGGMKGDNQVIFTADRGSGNDAATVITLSVANLGVSTGGGGVGVTIVNVQQRALLQNIDGIENPGTKTASYPGAVSVTSGIKATATPNNPMATVANSFQSFGTHDEDANAATPETPDRDATLGSFSVALSSEATARHRNAADGSVVTELTVLIAAATGAAANAPGDDSSVTIMGDFSFVEKAWLDDGTDCADTDGTTETDLRITNSDGMVTDTTMLQKQSLGYVNSRPNLCIRVPVHTEDEPVSIPATDAYTAMTMYKTGTATGMMVPADGSHDLGMITRDGTTVRLPYLSTNEKFNQRIRMVNRSSNEARYELDFHGNGDMDGMDAIGTLAANAITVLSLRDNDVVTPGSGTATSATLIIEAQKGMVDVATVQTNRETGNTDYPGLRG